MNLRLFFFIIVNIFFVILAKENAHAQFIKLQDKYGTPSNEPIQQKPDERALPSGDALDVGPGALPATTTSIAGANGSVTLNGSYEIEDLIKQISAISGRNFILNDKVKGKIRIISESPMPKDMAYQVFLSALEVNGMTPVETPAGLINIVAQKDSLTKPIDLYTDESPNTDKFITRIVQLQNISANDLQMVIKPMVSKNGNMFAYPTTNSLVVTDTGSNIDHLLRLIRELDQEGPQEVLDIVPIINADAKDIASKISDIFTDSKDKQGGAAIRNRRVGSRGGGTDLEDVQAISKIISDERTNSVIIMGTKRSIIKIKALIARLDRPLDGIEGTIHVYYLKHAKAKELSEVLSNLVSGTSGKTDAKASGKGAAAKKESGGVELEGGVKVTADEATNSLVMTASPKDYTTLVEKVIRKLDIVRPQVYLESVIMSLSVSKVRSLGFNAFGGFPANIFGETLNSFGNIAPLLGGSATGVGSLGSIAGAGGGFSGGAVSERTISFTGADGAAVEVPAISAIIQALQTDNDANVLSTPSIMTLDNEEAQIQVGQEVPVPTGTSIGTGVSTVSVSREDVGIILKITPQITENNSVNLKIAQEITVVSSNDPTLGPTLDKKSVETVVLANNRQTIVIGGLIDDQYITNRNKVPGLGDIPIIGNMFKNTTTTKTKQNLLVFITPYIIRERKDYLEILKKKIEERNSFIDLNFGKSQQKRIRESIENHAADLLVFKCKRPKRPDVCSPNYSYHYSQFPDIDGRQSERGVSSRMGASGGRVAASSSNKSGTPIGEVQLLDDNPPTHSVTQKPVSEPIRTMRTEPTQLGSGAENSASQDAGDNSGKSTYTDSVRSSKKRAGKSR